jgi:hypothetical protein
MAKTEYLIHMKQATQHKVKFVPHARLRHFKVEVLSPMSGKWSDRINTPGTFDACVKIASSMKRIAARVCASENGKLWIRPPQLQFKPIGD